MEYVLTQDEFFTVQTLRKKYRWSAFVFEKIDEGELNMSEGDCKQLSSIFVEQGFPALHPDTELFCFLVDCVISAG